ncbi:hypothetical protein EKH55_2693 [Sinorhizobium alkalisoli]|nr:hypothetical protein EKH55_2693 [Sinorhizobium alkalisoli]
MWKGQLRQLFSAKRTEGSEGKKTKAQSSSSGRSRQQSA